MGGPDPAELCAVDPDSAPSKALCSFGLHRLGREGNPGVRAAQSGTSIVNRPGISAPLHHYTDQPKSCGDEPVVTAAGKGGARLQPWCRSSSL